MSRCAQRGALIALLACACGRPSSVAPGAVDAPVAVTPARDAAPTSLPVVGPSLGPVGLETTSLDRSVDPCGDFYQFACGGWIQANPVPADLGGWDRFTAVQRVSRDRARRTLEAAHTAKDPLIREVGILYGSCLDEEAIERAGTSAIDPLLVRAAAGRDPRTIGAAIIDLMAHGVPTLFLPRLTPDPLDARTSVLALWPGELPLPLSLSSMQPAARAALETHLTRLFGLLGRDPAQAAAAAADVIAVHSALAWSSPRLKHSMDPGKTSSAYTVAELAALAPWIDWPAAFRALGAPRPRKVIVAAPAYWRLLGLALERVPAAAWAHYLEYRVLNYGAAILAVPRRFRDELQALRSLESGAAAPSPHWEHCLDLTSAVATNLVGRAFTSRHLDDATRAQVAAMDDALRDELARRLEGATWMSAPTRAHALAKLARMGRTIGKPKRWDPERFRIDPRAFGTSFLAGVVATNRRSFATIDHPVRDEGWQGEMHAAGASYSRERNHVVVSAGILAPPFFGASRAVAANLGALGTVLGHELTHAFDVGGAQYDARGELGNWWTPADAAHFAERTECLVDQFGADEAAPGVRLDGAQTRDENLADLGGVSLAFRAYRRLTAGAPAISVGGFTPDQQFFLGLGQAFCANARPEWARTLLREDTHAPPRLRVNGMLRNLPEFATAFACPVGTPMAPAKTCPLF